ncbi:MAG: hypothetical protein ABSF90_11860 [Syntrophobacteraceae bacterium]|jgi:uncharacterized membrane protein YgcG
MGTRLLFVVLLTLAAGLCRFTGTAYAQDAHYYTCYAPDGTSFESVIPCDNYYEYDYDYPGMGYFNFDFDRHHGHDRDVDRDSGSRSHGDGDGRSVEHGGGMRGGGATHGGGGHEGH